MSDESKPLVYSCSGCSNVAQLANDLAVTLDRENMAEMSCIAGLGGDVKSLVRKAKSKRAIIAIDGCPLNCTANSLARHDLEADHHIQLNDLGLRKRYHRSSGPADAHAALRHVYERLGHAPPDELPVFLRSRLDSDA